MVKEVALYYSGMRVYMSFFFCMSPRFIDIRVKDVTTNLWNRITFVSGEPRV
jgi:hypothetical protein